MNANYYTPHERHFFAELNHNRKVAAEAYQRGRHGYSVPQVNRDLTIAINRIKDAITIYNDRMKKLVAARSNLVTTGDDRKRQIYHLLLEKLNKYENELRQAFRAHNVLLRIDSDYLILHERSFFAALDHKRKVAAAAYQRSLGHNVQRANQYLTIAIDEIKVAINVCKDWKKKLIASRAAHLESQEDLDRLLIPYASTQKKKYKKPKSQTKTAKASSKERPSKQKSKPKAKITYKSKPLRYKT